MGRVKEILQDELARVKQGFNWRHSGPVVRCTVNGQRIGFVRPTISGHGFVAYGHVTPYIDVFVGGSMYKAKAKNLVQNWYMQRPNPSTKEK